LLGLVPRHKLTKRLFSRIRNSTREYFNSSHHKPSEQGYYKIIAENNIVACYKCRMEIRMGDEYETNWGGSISRKYYHTECFESLYHE
jgi:hypothetical protein